MKVRIISASLVIAGFAFLNMSFAANEDVASLSDQLKKGKQSSVGLLSYYQKRIAEYNPPIQAVTALNPQALAQAQEADSKMKFYHSPLAGIPIVIKDNIAAKGMATTAGSLTLEKNIALEDAPIVAKLRAAGVVIAGKANLSEWANFRSTKASSGWSSAGGQTRNPYDLARSPCGSSSGSAAAVAARLIPAAIGTETDGSIVCPAAVNGVVG